MFQPVELQAMVVGNENYDWEELQRVSDVRHFLSVLQTFGVTELWLKCCNIIA